MILTYLKNQGFDIDYIDCLDKKLSFGTFGRGKYYSEIIQTPSAVKSIPRRFKRYGMPKLELEKLLEGKTPDYILLTSSMTYWYPAIKELSSLLKNKFPRVPIVLGGTYASLCAEHARKNKAADFIFANQELDRFFELLNCRLDQNELFSTLPDYDSFYQKLDYLVLRTSWGCPFDCSFCAIKRLSQGFFRIDHKKIVDFILKFNRQGLKHFVLYDDAFLYQPEYAKKLLGEIKRLNLDIDFHTPNALHLKFLDQEIADLLKKTGFINPHFGLEILDEELQKAWGDKVTKDELIQGINLLKKSGFKNGEFSVYLLLGWPGQNLENLRSEAEFINRLGARVSLAEYSPVPQTRIFNSHQEILEEPLLQNNSLFGFFQKEKIKEFWEIKNYVRDLNKSLAG